MASRTGGSMRGAGGAETDARRKKPTDPLSDGMGTRQFAWVGQTISIPKTDNKLRRFVFTRRRRYISRELHDTGQFWADYLFVSFIALVLTKSLILAIPLAVRLCCSPKEGPFNYRML